MSLLSPQLEAFVSVQRNGTVLAASRELGITQTGVTQRIRSLEASLGTTLFVRSRKGMRLTPEGEALLRYCTASRDLEGEAMARIAKAGANAEVRVGITGPTSILRSRVIPQCAEVMRAYPNLLMSFDIIDLESRVELLRRGEAQFALLEPRNVAREMESKLLRPERYLLVAPARWKSRPLRAIVKEERIIDFDPTDTMSHAYLGKFGLLEIARAERHFVNNTEAVSELIRAGLGYGVLTAEFAEEHLRRGELVALNQGRANECRLALAWYRRPQPPAYFDALIKAIR